MKTDSLVLQNWDDLVFENRNKEYGAYSVRKSYSENVNIAFAVCLMMGVGVFAGYHLHSLFTSNNPGLEIKKGDIPFILPPPPSIIKDKIEVKPPANHIKTVNQNLQVKVVDKIVTTTLPENPTIVDNGPDVPIDGTPTLPTEGIGVGEPTQVVSVPKVFLTAEVMPSYEGGMEAMMRFISKKIKYPNSAKHMGIEGITYVQFVVNTNGEVTDISVLKGFNAACDAEAARVIALMKDWKAGMQNHIPVSVRMVLPIKFKIAE